MTAEQTQEVPSPDDEVFEQAELWPERLTLVSASGLTLWGPGGHADGRDRVLTVGGQLVLAGSEASLRRFVAQDTTSSLAGLPGYERLREVAAAGAVPFQPEVEFDYRAVAAALDWPPSEWDRDRSGQLLDAMNMLFDVATALGDRELADQFEALGYGALVERFTFLDEEEVPAAVAGLDVEGLRVLLGMSLDRIESRVTDPG